MAWIAIIAAGLCEVLGVFALKRLLNNRHWTSYVLVVITFLTSFGLLSYAMTELSMGTAYAVWTGIGTAGSTLLGMFVFGEPKEWKRLASIAVIVASVIGLKLIA